MSFSDATRTYAAPWAGRALAGLGAVFIVAIHPAGGVRPGGAEARRPTARRAAGGLCQARAADPIRYARELHAGAVVSITTVVDEIHERKIRFTHTMRNDDTGELAASTTILGVHLDTTARKACAFAPQIVERAQALLASAGPGHTPC